MTKQERIKEYNNLFDYHITNTKKMTESEIESRIKYGVRSLDELYKTYSNAKRESWEWIQRTYKPKAILSVSGNCMAYSVLLVAWNGDKLHITRDNNYLVEVV